MGKYEKRAKGKRPRRCSIAERRLGRKLDFRAKEAYKLLRTNLRFSLPEKAGCKIIGITSALGGEGKTTTAMNLVCTMAQTGARVLLLEADLRLPALAKQIHLRQRPGLSNLLAGQCSVGEVLQISADLDGAWVITAGDIPPNPAELLGSGQLEARLSELAQYFDMIVVDLPPVMVVSDALQMSRLADGIILVVRQDVCQHGALEETVRKLRFAKARLLGYVLTDADVPGKRRYQYGGNYGQRISK